MNKTLTNQVIALAGLSQAVYLIQQIARTGDADREAITVLIASTLKIDAEDVLDVYGGLAGLTIGLKQLIKQFTPSRRIDPELARYSSALLYLQQQLLLDPSLTEAVGVVVSRASTKADSAGMVLDETVLEELAEGYQRTISTLKPRVLVSGDQKYLSVPYNAQRIRALLLAGIRSAVLWRQCGGVRWKLIWVRWRILREAQSLLDLISKSA